MAGRPKDSIRHFMRLSERRLATAGFLLNALRSGDDPPEGLANVAVENAAMAVECALKGLILGSTPTRDRSEAEATFRGSSPHRPEWLKAQIRARGVALPRTVIQSLARMSWWDYDLRYNLKVIPTGDALDFLAEADIVVTWVRERV